MGMAMLVPGVSGGTMILVMGLYDEFINAIADVTCLRITRRNVTFLAVVGLCAALTIATLADWMRWLVTDHQSAMFALFIGMTLGGVPALARRFTRFDTTAGIGLVIGMTIILAIALTGEDVTHSSEARAAASLAASILEPAYVRDFIAGAVGICAMVLPGISGAYMVLVLGRYESILAAIAAAKESVMSFGDEAGFAFLHVLIPVGVGAAVSLIVASNFLKWMLRNHPQPLLGLLLGILLGSVVGLWPFDASTGLGEIAVATSLAGAGFFSTYLLSRVSR